MGKKYGGIKRVALKKWIKPVVKSEKLSTRSLFSVGGWFKNSNRLNTIALTTAI